MKSFITKLISSYGELFVLCAVLFVASQWPTFAMACNISSDEFQKTSAGGGSALIILAAYAAWKGKK